MSSFDPSKSALLHEQLNDRIDEWPGVPLAEWRSRAIWHDWAKRVINWDGLLYDGWCPPLGTSDGKSSREIPEPDSLGG